MRFSSTSKGPLSWCRLCLAYAMIFVWAEPAAAQVLLAETFEDGASGWTAEGIWAIGPPSTGPESGFESATAAGTNLAGPYTPNSTDRLISPPLVLPPDLPYRLKFWEWFDLEAGFDFGDVEISTDNGASWTPLGLFRTGTSDWRLAEFDLSDVRGETVLVSFRLDSDDSVQEAGWFIDAVIVEPASVLDVALAAVDVSAYPLMTVEAESATAIEAFTVTEDGQPVTLVEARRLAQPEAGRPIDLVFAFDASGSMTAVLPEIQQTVQTLIDQLEEEQFDVRLGALSFARNIGQVLLPTADLAEAARFVESIEVQTGTFAG
ncbi:MAG: VWA domain-containing protein, partial [Bacteroidota bacterium]